GLQSDEVPLQRLPGKLERFVLLGRDGRLGRDAQGMSGHRDATLGLQEQRTGDRSRKGPAACSSIIGYRRAEGVGPPHRPAEHLAQQRRDELRRRLVIVMENQPDRRGIRANVLHRTLPTQPKLEKNRRRTSRSATGVKPLKQGQATAASATISFTIGTTLLP